MSGFALQIDGCEYLFATAGVTSLPTSSDADWPSDLTLLSAALDPPRGSIIERAKPIDGDVDINGLTLRIHDLTPASGSAAGQLAITWLGARFTSAIAQTILTQTVSSAEAATIHVSDTSAFPASGTIWLDQEAIAYTGKTGTTFTTLTRGKFGSFAANHVVDTAYSSYAPVVFHDFPGFEGRRVVLYRVDDANVATVLWIGVVRNGPKFIEGDKPEAGALWEFSCESAWAIERDTRLGIQSVGVRLVGYDATAIRASYYDSRRRFCDSYGAPGTFFVSLDDALAWHRENLTTAMASAGVIGECIAFRRTGDGVFLHVHAQVDILTPPYTYAPCSAQWVIGNVNATHTGVSTADPHYVEVLGPPAPDVAHKFPIGATDTMPVDTIAGLPSTWTPVAAPADPPYATTLRYCLLGSWNSDYDLQFAPTAVTAGNPPTITGVPSLVPKNNNAVASAGRYASVTIDTVVPFYLCARIDTTHWYDGMRYGVFTPNVIVDAGVDSRNWDFATNANAIISATGASPSQRVWFLDGRRTVGEFVRGLTRINGIGLGVRHGRVCPFVLRPPLASDNPAATIVASDLASKASWARNPDGVVNTITLEGDGLSITINDKLSVARFGQQRTVKLAIPGNDELRLIAPNVNDLRDYAVSRFLNLWTSPTYVRTVRLTMQHVSDVFVGDYVQLTEWLTPNGTGGRGPSAILCQVIGKETPLEGGAQHMVLTLLSYAQQVGHGYAPCAKVASITTNVLTLALNYLGAGASPAGTSANTDYAGSNLASYTGTANDGGASRFSAGDKVKLIRRNVTTVTEETGFTIQSVNPGAGTITLTTNPTTVVGADWWDVVFDNYGNGSTVSAHEKQYAWTASYSSGVIGTSTDAAQTWSP